MLASCARQTSFGEHFLLEALDGSSKWRLPTLEVLKLKKKDAVEIAYTLTMKVTSLDENINEINIL